MKTVHKFQLNVGFNSIALHSGYKILKAGEQYGLLCIWVLHDTSDQQVMVNLEVHPTGAYLNGNDTEIHVDSILTEFNEMWHIFLTGGAEYAG